MQQTIQNCLRPALVGSSSALWSLGEAALPSSGSALLAAIPVAQWRHSFLIFFQKFTALLRVSGH